MRWGCEKTVDISKITSNNVPVTGKRGVTQYMS